MSLREKQLWASLVAGLLVWGAYALRIIPILLDPGHPHPARSTGLAFLIALIVFMVAEGALAAAMAWFQRRQRPAQDQALTDAALVAGQVALVVLISLVVLTLIALWIFAVWIENQYAVGIGATLLSRAPMLLANLLLLEILFAEGVRTILTLLLVRRR
jgi:multisubunit Na+/H+ antiporter MnhB subunit